MSAIDSPLLKEVRGKGLLTSTIESCTKVVRLGTYGEQMAVGLLAKPTHRHIIRLAPTRNQRREGKEAIQIIRKSIKRCGAMILQQHQSG